MLAGVQVQVQEQQVLALCIHIDIHKNGVSFL